MDTKRSDKKHLYRSEDALPLEMASMEGSIITDISGKEYIDFLSGWCVGNIGWGNGQVREAIRGYNGPDYVPPHLV